MEVVLSRRFSFLASLMFSGEAINFIESGQNFDRKFTCDIIYK